jgi:hypothetical protein
VQHREGGPGASPGADHVIDYSREDFADGQHRYDVILDIGGNRRLSHLRHALTRKGTFVIVGGETNGRWLGGTDRQLRAQLLSLVVSQKLGTFVSSENAVDLVTLRELIEAGQIKPVVDRIYPLSERSPRPSATSSTAAPAARSSSPWAEHRATHSDQRGDFQTGRRGDSLNQRETTLSVKVRKPR